MIPDKVDSEDLKINLRNASELKQPVFADFSMLNISLPLAYGFKLAFDAIHGSFCFETKAHSWRHLKLFAQYLVSNNYQEPLPPTILLTFTEWLSPKEYSTKYKATIFYSISTQILWLSRNIPELIHPSLRTDFPRIKYIKDKPLASPLNESDIKAILFAAYKEIDEISTRIFKFRNATASSLTDKKDIEIYEILQLVKINNGLIISDKQFKKFPRASLKKVRSAGGLDKVSTYLYPSIDEIFPFYLAALCQCSANPMSFRNLERDHIWAHPLRQDRKRISWTKSRSGYEQRSDFSSQRTRSAPNLIELLLKLSEPIVQFASAHERNMVFLAYRRGRVAVPCWQSLHLCLNRFISRHNLPEFDFKHLRRSGAELHEVAAGSILSAKGKLNHQSSLTTRKYLSGKGLKDVNDHIVLESQNVLYANLLAVKPSKNTTPITASEKSMETVFGFICADPFAGLAMGTSPGSLCTKFNGCATCPGAIIPLDDPHIIAKLIQSLNQLHSTKIRATEEGWIERYKAIYESTQNIIEIDLLPKVRKSVLEKATKLVSAIKCIPHLE